MECTQVWFWQTRSAGAADTGAIVVAAAAEQI